MRTNRFLSLLLAAALALTLLLPVAAADTAPYGSSAENGTVSEQRITASFVLGKLAELRKSYPQGMTWTNANSYTWRGGIWSTGYGCVAFARKLSDYIYGDLPARKYDAGKFAFSDIRVGDIIDTNFYGGHTMIVIDVTPTDLAVAEGNYLKTVNWDRRISKSSVMANTNYLVTRYPCYDHNLVNQEVKSTCTVQGYKCQMCTKCEAKFNVVYYDLLPHTDKVSKVVKPTCTDWGYTEYKCSVCGRTRWDDYTETIPHDYQVQRVIEPTCTDWGYTEYRCSVCGQTTEDDYTYSLGHDWDEGEVTKAPTYTQSGIRLYHCTRCDETMEDYISSTGIPSGVYITDTRLDAVPDRTGYPVNYDDDPEGAGGLIAQSYSDGVTEYVPVQDYMIEGLDTSKIGKETLSIYYYGTVMPYDIQVEFTDVYRQDKYYYGPIYWAVESGVTAGTSATKFSPGNGCTRAQVVTFLWRAAGKPEPQSDVNPFEDVTEDKYYYKAVLWAVENKIAAGLKANRFGPNETCTRAQVVTFLWRATGKEAPETADNPFEDVAEKNYFFNPVLWAVEKGITNGTTPTTFSPDNTCTRAQVVTFLYRVKDQIGTRQPEQPEDKPETPANVAFTLLVRDTEGNPVPGAKVQVSGTGFSLTDTVGADGGLIIDCPPATYEVTVEAEGFVPVTQEVTNDKPGVAYYIDLLREEEDVELTEIAPGEGYYSLLIPGEWLGSGTLDWEVSERPGYGYNVQFYSVPDREAGFGGHLFTLALIPSDEDYSYLPSYDYLCSIDVYRINQFDVVAIYPTDVQFDYTSGGGDAYKTMRDGVPFIISTLDFNDEVTVTDIAPGFDFLFIG